MTFLLFDTIWHYSLTKEVTQWFQSSEKERDALGEPMMSNPSSEL